MSGGVARSRQDVDCALTGIVGAVVQVGAQVTARPPSNSS